jgi:ABC-2 type transport system ATP-binding protein
MIPIEVQHVTKRYGEKVVVNQADITVQEGEIFGLLGANGAGKTTTMRMVLGLIAPDSGNIRWYGEKYSKRLRQMIGYLPEERGLYQKAKVSDQILYLAELRGVPRRQADILLKKWLERFDIVEYYNKKVEELSKGNQQKIQFIASAIHHPKILIMDEVFSGLDPINVELLKKTIKDLQKEGTTILFSSHRMEHIEELCENICMLHKGNVILTGCLKEIKRTFPKDRVLLETDREVDGLDKIAGVTSIKKQDTKYEICISNLEVTKSILSEATNQSHVHCFQIIEPSLNEIFISKVGESF